VSVGSRHSMNDETLDRELADLFAVDPSPAFLPSVRARVDAEVQRRAPWRWTWMPALAVVTLALLLVGVRPWSTSDSAPTMGPAPVESTSASAPAPTVPTEAVLMAGAVALRAPQTRVASRRARRALPATKPTPFDDIQLSAAEQRFLRDVRTSWRDAADDGVVVADVRPLPRDADAHPVIVPAIAVPELTDARVVIEPTALMAPREE
jgi:hypothetical protein